MPDGRRAFMMGNALVVGLIERVGRELMGELREGHGMDEAPVERGEAVGVVGSCYSSETSWVGSRSTVSKAWPVSPFASRTASISS